jgi:hypothetical protein
MPIKLFSLYFRFYILDDFGFAQIFVYDEIRFYNCHG